MYSMGLNSTLGFILVVTIIFTVGEVHEILNTPTGQPFIQIFFNGTNNSYAGTNVMTGIIIITLTASVVAEIATASRQLWSFARDNGVPFSRYLSRVSNQHSSIADTADSKLTSKGHPRLEHSSQCCLSFSCSHNPPFPYQYRKHSRPASHPFRQHRESDDFL